MSYTDAEILKGKVAALASKTTDFHEQLLVTTELADQIKDLALSVGTDGPLVGPLIDIAIDNLGSANHMIGQVTEIVETWAKKL